MRGCMEERRKIKKERIWIAQGKEVINITYSFNYQVFPLIYQFFSPSSYHFWIITFDGNAELQNILLNRKTKYDFIVFSLYLENVGIIKCYNQLYVFFVFVFQELKICLQYVCIPQCYDLICDKICIHKQTLLAKNCVADKKRQNAILCSPRRSLKQELD